MVYIFTKPFSNSAFSLLLQLSLSIWCEDVDDGSVVNNGVENPNCCRSSGGRVFASSDTVSQHGWVAVSSNQCWVMP